MNVRRKSKVFAAGFVMSIVGFAGVLGACSSGSDSDDSAGHGGNWADVGNGGTNQAGSNATGNGGASVGGQSSSGTGGKTGASGNTGTSGSGSSTGGTTSTSASACSNGIDDDGDGLVDGFDAECTGPDDNDEGTFATGIPGDNRDPKWQDCFFDGNSGAGDDDCRYATDCLYGKLPADDPDCVVTDACVKFCAPLTQNGCDCFGCCTVVGSDGKSVDIAENAGCSLANLDDTDACVRCTKSTQCGNECGTCELCPGKTAEDLPESCKPPTGTGGTPGAGGDDSGAGGSAGDTGAGGTTNNGGTTSAGGSPPAYTCDTGTVCASSADCGSSEYCSLGCCVPAIR